MSNPKVLDLTRLVLNEVANECEDLTVLTVCIDLLERSAKGQAKYGTTLDRTDLTIQDWQQHLYEELLDATNYLKRIQRQQ